MLINGYEEQPPRQKASVCIIGGGAAGITIARDLASDGIDTILLEGGDLSYSQQSQMIYDSENVGINYDPTNSRLRHFGGTTNHWSGWCCPVQEHYFSTDAVQNPFPFSYDSLVPYYEQAQITCQLGPFDYDPESVLDRQFFTRNSSVLDTVLYQYSPPTRFGEVYKDDIAQAESLRAIISLNLVDIVLSDDLTTVKEIRCRTWNEQEVSIEADIFILALGGIENARMLLNCDSQLAGGIANSSGLVGLGFAEHPHFYGLFRMVATEPQFFQPYWKRTVVEFEENGETKEFTARPAIRLSESITEERGFPQAAWTFSRLRDDAPPTGIPADVIAAINRNSQGYQVLYADMRASQTISDASKVSLDPNERDELGLRKTRLDWDVPFTDMMAYREMMKTLAYELNRMQLGKCWIDIDEAGFYAYQNIAPGNHHMATTRMNASSMMGVVDADCRTHDHKNLFIAGSSVFPATGYANPTLTIVALAHRLAEKVADEIIT